MKRNLATATALAVLLAGFGGTLPASAATPDADQDLLVAGLSEEVIADLSAAERDVLVSSLSDVEQPAVVTVVTLLDSVPQFETVSVEESSASEVASILQSQPSVEVAGVSQPVFLQADTHRSSQWPLNTLRAEESRALLPGGVRPVVAVLDTGVLGTHPDLQNAVRPGKDFVITDGSSDGRIDPHGHGTHVAGIIGASVDNSIGVAGFLSNVDILPVRVMDGGGNGNTSLTAQGVTWAANNGADVINLSLGGPGHDPALQYAVDYAVSRGVTVVAAMGNAARDPQSPTYNATSYPAAYPSVLAVGATDRNDVRGDFSNFGPHIDVVAPGVSVISTGAKEGAPYVYMSGTSMAAPHVAGVVAGLGAKRPELTPAQLQDHLQRTARDLGTPGFDAYHGHGLVDPYRAYSATSGQDPATLPSAPAAPVVTPGNTQASVSWTAPASTGSSALTGYTLTFSTPGAPGVVRDVPATPLNATVSGLTNGTTYSVAVTARNSQGVGPASAAVNVTPRTVPSAPSISSTVRGDAQVTLNWNAPSSNGGAAITGYEASITSPGGAPSTQTVPGNVTSTTFTGLTNGVSYTMLVRAVNAAGSSVNSAPGYAVPLGAPGAPSVSWVKAQDRAISLAWDRPTSDGGDTLTEYVVTATSVAGNKSVSVPAGTYSTTLEGLTNDVAYTVSVQARNSKGLSPASASQVVTPVGVPAPVGALPDAPSITRVESREGSLNVVWNTPEDNGSAISGYRVSLTQPGQPALERTASGSATSLVVTGLTNGVSYGVQVRAVNAVGASAPSASVSGTPYTPTSRNPFGSFDGAQAVPGGARLSGWAIDPDTASPLELHVHVDGGWGGTITANASRPDVGNVYPLAGSSRGFDKVLALSAGTHQVCVFAINEGIGTTNPLLGCKSVNVPGGNPFGNVEAASAAPGTITVGGWALDPDVVGAIPVHVYVDGRYAASQTADRIRGDVAAHHAGWNNQKGFSVTVPAGAGARQVCVFGINQASGTTNPLLGCKNVTLPGGNPFGNVEVATAAPGTITVGGWALDPDVVGAIPVHVYVDGRYAASQTADRARPDVALHHVGWNGQKGFSVSVPATAGARQVCVFAINQDTGTTNPLLGCKNVTLPGGSPVGNLEALTGGTGNVNLVGWALDPDVAGAIPVHVYIDGRPAATPTADQVRNDVALHYPSWNNQKGFNLTLPAERGVRQVCVYAINQGTGTNNTTLGCKSITVS